ncbi:MAG: phosphonate ABC transporter, permease protein PhnE [Caldiserica bacterium]|nr:phosphonate ABC transporter, permease protein PhnE [Caldisericota bacterium]
MAVKPSAAIDAARLRRRLFALFLDWLTWGYVAYAVMYFLQEYWWSRTLYGFYNPLTLPGWGWPAAVLGTLAMAALCELTGYSLGERALKLERREERPLSREELLTGKAAGKPFWRTQWGVMSILLLALTVALGWHVVKISPEALLNPSERAREMLGEIFPPDFRYFFTPDPAFELRGFPYSILNLMVVTVFMALLATVLGAAVALPLSFFGARNIMGVSPAGWFVYGIVRGFFNVFRSIETMLWAVVFAIWIRWGSPLAGIMALTVHTIAALGKLYSEQVEGIDPGPVEAVVAAGGSRLEVIRYAVLPQVVPSFWAFTLYRWDINVRMSTVIALVGGGGIGDMLFYYKNEGEWALLGAVMATIVAVVWAMDYLSGRLRERIV